MITNQFFQTTPSPATVFLSSYSSRLSVNHQPYHTPWGKLLVSKGEVLSLRTPKRHIDSPPHFAIWVPAYASHFTPETTVNGFFAINVTLSHCTGLPKIICQFEVTPLIAAIIEDLSRRNVGVPSSEADIRLMTVLLDKLKQAPQTQSFLPSTQHPLICPIIARLTHMPNHPRTLAKWAEKLKTTERSLARHFKTELGISFTEWRARKKYLTSLKMLEKGISPAEIITFLGYTQSGPFISLFKKYSGMTPEQYRQTLRDNHQQTIAICNT